MAPSIRLPPHFPRTHLLLDWDSTLTQTDTLSLIARIGYTTLLPSHSSTSSPTTTPPRPPHPSPTPTPNPKPKPPFAILVNAYLHDLQSHTATYLPSPPQRTTFAAELAFLESLRGVEERSVRRVEGAGVFVGVTGTDVDCAAGRCVDGGEVVLRRGWRGLVRGVLGGDVDGEGVQEGVEGKGKVGVVSVGWSGRFIRGSLLRAVSAGGAGGGGEEVGDGEGRKMVGEMEIVANEIERLDDADGSQGMLSRWFDGVEGGGVWTAGDKGRVVRRLVAEDCVEERKGGEGRERTRTVYVGDSVTDLECLMLVDVGICIRDEPLQSGQEALRETLGRIGVECRWIGGMQHERVGHSDRGLESGSGGGMKGLWWARDFEEIHESALFRGPTEPGCETSEELLSNSLRNSGP